MEREPTITELLSQIKLMELALNFYADDNNYDIAINKDHGHQARFALQKMIDISDYNVLLNTEVDMLAKEIEKEEVKFGGKEMTLENIKIMLEILNKHK